MYLPLLITSYVAGLLLAPFFPGLAALPPFIMVCTIFWLVLHRRCSVIFRMLPLLFLGFGACLYHLYLQPPQSCRNISVFADGETVIVQGKVLNAMSGEESGCRIDLDTTQVFIDSIVHPCIGRLRLFVEEGNALPNPGDQIRFASKLRRPQMFGTPGEFNYPRYLAGQNIFATAFVGSTNDLVRFASPKRGYSLASIARFRQRVGQHIDQSVSPDLAPLVRALVIGDKQRITDEQTSFMAHAGISHLFAISGLHVGLVAVLLFWLARLIYRRSERLLLFQPPGRCLPLVILPLLWLYLQVSGNSLSAQRAFLMAFIAALLLSWSRRIPPLRILLAVAVILLLWKPLSFFEPSFQLSFAGVLGILTFLPRWQKQLKRTPKFLKWPVGVAAASLAATITTLPLVLLYFHLWSPAGLLTNLLAVPLIGMGAVPIGLAGMLVGIIWPAAGAKLFQFTAWITDTAWQMVRLVVSLPGLEGRTAYLSPTILTAIFFIVLALLLPSQRRLRLARLLLLACVVLLLALPSPRPDTLTVTALSVGQGDSLLLSLPDGRHYLVDGGGSYRNTFDTGARLVGPALGRLGVRSLEAVILSHDHPDHRQGLIHILEHFPVKTFWCGEKVEKLPLDLRRVLKERQIPVKTFNAGWTVAEKPTEDVNLEIFVPNQPEAQLNDRSLVLYARYRQDGVLLTGDLEKPGVEELLSAPPGLPVTLLKLPHHGSRYSDPCQLVDRFLPQAVFASQGSHNPYGLPHAEVVEALRDRSVPFYRTDEDKTLKFVSHGKGWQLGRWRDGLFR